MQRIIFYQSSTFGASSHWFCGLNIATSANVTSNGGLRNRNPSQTGLNAGLPGTLNHLLMDFWLNNHFSYEDLVHHPTETTIYKWMASRFQVGIVLVCPGLWRIPEMNAYNQPIQLSR